MADQTIVTFNGQRGLHQWSIGESSGTSPDSGKLVYHKDATLPVVTEGDLVITRGTYSRTFVKCRIVEDQPVRSRGHFHHYTIYDRRWKWAYAPPISGEYNVRDKDKELIASTVKSPIEMAQLLLIQMGEPDFDVSVLPNDPELSPHVDWDIEQPAVALNRLLSLFACDVVILPDDTVLVIEDGTGTVPDDTQLVNKTFSGTQFKPIPEYIVSYSDDTLYDGFLYAEPIGYELDGTAKPISALSYRPPDGWEKTDPSRTAFMGLRTHLKNTLALSNEDEALTYKLAVRHIFKTYRVTGFAEGQDKPFEFPDISYDNNSADWQVIESDYSTLVSSHATEGEAQSAAALRPGSIVVGPGTTAEYGQAGYTNATTDWQIIDDTATLIGSYTQRYLGERAMDGLDDHILVPPNHTVFKPFTVLPLENKRLAYGDQLNGRRERVDAEVIGDFLLNADTTTTGVLPDGDKYASWIGGFSLNVEDGIFHLSSAAFRRFEDASVKGVVPARMYIRTGYRLRNGEYGEYFRHQYQLPTGSASGAAALFVGRTDVQRNVIGEYTNTYIDFGTGVATDNVTAVETVLSGTCTEKFKEFQGTTGPITKVYFPIREIPLDGIVRQIKYSGGVTASTTMTVSIGFSGDFSMVPAVQKRRQAMQTIQLEEEARNHTSPLAKRRQNAISNKKYEDVK